MRHLRRRVVTRSVWAARAGIVAASLAGAALLAGLPGAQASPSPSNTATARDLINYLHSIAGTHTLSGQEDGSNPTSMWNDKVNAITGVRPGVWGGDFAFASSDVAARQAVIDEAKHQWAAGSIPALMWHMCPPTVASTCDWWSPGILAHLDDSQWNDMLTPGTALNRSLYSRFDEAVPFLRQLQAAGIPVSWRPFHEINEGWAWWGGRPGSNGSAQLYRLLHDYYVNTKGLTNLVWQWNTKDVNASQMSQYYPGDNYVDLVTLDSWYNNFPSQTFYDTVLGIANGKPIALAEVGKVPTPAELASQPLWTYWSVWMSYLTDNNSNDEIKTIYYDPRTLNQGHVSFGGTTTPPPTTPPAAGGVGAITGLAGKCVDVRASGTANGTPVQLYTCAAGIAQTWAVGADGTVRNQGKCLDVTGQLTGNGTKIQIWDCNGQSNQTWRYEPSTSRLINPVSGRCLDVPGQNTADSTQLQIWDCNGESGQAWSLPTANSSPPPTTTPPTTTPPTTSPPTMTPPAAGGVGAITGLAGKCVDVRASGTANGTPVQLYTCAAGIAQTWAVGADGTVRNQGKCLDVTGQWIANGTKIQIWDCNGQSNQTWRYEPSTSRLINPVSGRCLDVPGQNTADSTQLQIWDCNGESGQVWSLPAVSGSPPPSGGAGAMAVAPYIYEGWGSPPDPATIMASTGVKWFTMAFVLSNGYCSPQWDGSRGLIGGVDQATVNAIRANGGDIVPSFGGYSGNKLESSCSTAGELADAYQKVIDAYGLKAIDIDIEDAAYASATVQQRTVDALKRVRAANPAIRIYVTFGTGQSGPDSTLIAKAAASGLSVDAWTIMPFDFGGAGQNMGNLTAQAAEGLKNALKTAYGYSDDAAYRHSGISSMNGITDNNETVTLSDFSTILDYANAHHLARLTFWSANRDRPCPSGYTGDDTCSGVPQQPWDFTRTLARYTG